MEHHVEDVQHGWNVHHDFLVDCWSTGNFISGPVLHGRMEPTASGCYPVCKLACGELSCSSCPLTPHSSGRHFHPSTGLFQLHLGPDWPRIWASTYGLPREPLERRLNDLESGGKVLRLVHRRLRSYRHRVWTVGNVAGNGEKQSLTRARLLTYALVSCRHHVSPPARILHEPVSMDCVDRHLGKQPASVELRVSSVLTSFSARSCAGGCDGR